MATRPRAAVSRGDHSVLGLEEADQHVRQHVQRERAGERDEREAADERGGGGAAAAAAIGAGRRSRWRRRRGLATEERLKTPITSRIRSFHRIARIRLSLDPGIVLVPCPPVRRMSERYATRITVPLMRPALALAGGGANLNDAAAEGTMADELVFYTNPMSRGRIARWMLEEVGQPYRTVLLDFATTAKAPEYLALNPMGKVPTIVHGRTVVTECAAVCAYLADAFPEAGLAPEPARRGAYYRWMFFAAGPLGGVGDEPGARGRGAARARAHGRLRLASAASWTRSSGRWRAAAISPATASRRRRRLRRLGDRLGAAVRHDRGAARPSRTTGRGFRTARRRSGRGRSTTRRWRRRQGGCMTERLTTAEREALLPELGEAGLGRGAGARRDPEDMEVPQLLRGLGVHGARGAGGGEAEPPSRVDATSTTWST